MYSMLWWKNLVGLYKPSVSFCKPYSIQDQYPIYTQKWQASRDNTNVLENWTIIALECEQEDQVTNTNVAITAMIDMSDY